MTVKASYVSLRLAAALVVSSCAVLPHSAAKLPHIRLRGGGEFRVVRVSYGTEHKCKDVRRLHFDAESAAEAEKFYVRTPGPAVAVWWGWVSPGSGGYALGPSGRATLLLPDGGKRNLDYPDPVGDIRVLLIRNPPTDIKRFALEIAVERERVQFEVNNPAYRP